MKLSIINIIYISLFVGITIIRKIYTSKFNNNQKKENVTFIEGLLFTLVGLSMIAPFFYIFSSWIDFANISIPVSIQVLGITCFISAAWLLWRSHSDLGKNWTVIIEKQENQTLITQGVYSKIRHPMYTAHIIWAMANILIIPNWIAGPAFLITSVFFYLKRIPKEEHLLMEEFKDDYKKYKSKTKLLFPYIW